MPEFNDPNPQQFANEQDRKHQLEQELFTDLFTQIDDHEELLDKDQQAKLNALRPQIRELKDPNNRARLQEITTFFRESLDKIKPLIIVKKKLNRLNQLNRSVYPFQSDFKLIENNPLYKLLSSVVESPYSDAKDSASLPDALKWADETSLMLQQKSNAREALFKMGLVEEDATQEEVDTAVQQSREIGLIPARKVEPKDTPPNAKTEIELTENQRKIEQLILDLDTSQTIAQVRDILTQLQTLGTKNIDGQKIEDVLYNIKAAQDIANINPRQIDAAILALPSVGKIREVVRSEIDKNKTELEAREARIKILENPQSTIAQIIEVLKIMQAKREVILKEKEEVKPENVLAGIQIAQDAQSIDGLNDATKFLTSKFNINVRVYSELRKKFEPKGLLSGLRQPPYPSDFMKNQVIALRKILNEK